MMRRVLLAGVLGIGVVVPGVAHAKGNIVAFGISGGAIPSEVRVIAGNGDLVWGVEPPRGRTPTPFRLTVYMWLATDPPQERATESFELHPPKNGRPVQLRYLGSDEWLGLSNEAAARVEAVLAGVVPPRPGATERNPAGAGSPMALAVLLALVLTVWVLASCGAIRSGRRLARAGRA